MIKPKYKYLTREIALEYPNALLILCWPEPYTRNDGYDIDALDWLDPDFLLLNFGPCGVSGSRWLIDYVCSDLVLAKETFEPADANATLGKLKLEKSIRYVAGLGGCFQGMIREICLCSNYGTYTYPTR